MINNLKEWLLRKLLTDIIKTTGNHSVTDIRLVKLYGMIISIDRDNMDISYGMVVNKFHTNCHNTALRLY